MTRFLIVLMFLGSGPSWSQSADNYVQTIMKLRDEGKLATKSSLDKTFVGSLTAYYDKDSIVLISSLTDAEAAGTETIYFVKGGILKKVFIMAATFDSNDEWKEYYSKHKSVDNCYRCHGKPNCIVTEITYGIKAQVLTTENRKKIEVIGEERERMLRDVKRTCEELQVLINGIK